MGRRGWTTLAALLVAGVAGVGVATGGLPRTDLPDGDAAPSARATNPSPPARESRQVFSLTVDLTRSGVVWVTTAGADCGGCVVVWRQVPDDEAWVPLRQVGSDHKPGQIRMADTGGEGVIGGAGLWVTHDGGNSWNAEKDVPVDAGAEVQAEIAGAHAWALVRRPGAAPVLWRTSLAGGGWREVALPAPLDPDAGPVAAGDALLLWVAGDRGPEAVATRDGGSTWQPLGSPCAGRGTAGTTPAYTTCSSRQGLEVALSENGAWQRWPVAAALGPAERLSPQTGATSLATAPGGIGYLVVRGGLLTTRDRGRTWSPVD